MTSERWRRIGDLFEATADLEAAERRRVLAAEDAEIAAEVEALVAAERADDELGRAVRASVASVFKQDEGSELGRRFGSWSTTRLLGRGGMSTVYLAARADRQFEKEVALKVLKEGMATDQLLRRFDRERHILARLEHPSIARILDAGTTEDGLPYFVMERVEGRPIDRYCDERRLGVEERLELFIEICMTVAHAHRNLVIHRDLKPSNILVTDKGRLKLLDFGIAKPLAADPSDDPDDVSAAHRLLTPGYASPEQIDGEAVTTATDVYSLGVVLFELLTGRRPHGPGAFSWSRSSQPPDPPSSAVVSAAADDEDIARRRGLSAAALRRRLAGDLDAVVVKALAPRPEDRYPSPAPLAQDLRRHLRAEPVTARPARFTYVAGRFLRRHRLAAALVGGALLTLVAFVAALIEQRRIAERERTKAERVASFLVDVFRDADPSVAQGEVLSARDLLDNGARRIDLALDDEPEAKAELLFTIGTVYQSLGHYDEAATCLEESLKLRRQVLDAGHPDVFDSLNQIAIVRAEQGAWAEAEVSFRETLELRREYLGDRHPDVAASLNNLALVLNDLGDYRAAEPVYREALALDIELFGRDHPSTNLTRGNLALLLFDQGSYGEAEALFRQVLALDLAQRGPKHPVVGSTQLYLGATEVALGHAEAGEARIEAALGLFREVLGPEHPNVARALQRLGEARLARGAMAAARAAHQAGLDLRRARLGERHPEVATSLTGLARVEAASGEAAAAESHLRAALELYRARVPASHPEVATALFELGRIVLEQGAAAEARALLEEALTIRRQAFNAEHPRCREVEAALAKVEAVPAPAAPGAAR